MTKVIVVKGQETKKHKLFAYTFAIMDLKTRMYIAFGSSKHEIREGGQGNNDALTY